MTYDRLLNLIEDTRLNKKPTLEISGLAVESIPDTIGKLKNLESLSISHTNIESLPKSICQLTNLKTLDINECQLKVLPNSIGQLTGLKSLDISFNKIEELPDSISKLSNLENFYAHNNRLEKLPDNIGCLGNLLHLSFYQNNIKELPDSFKNLKRLHQLLIDNNPFIVWPEEISELKLIYYFSIDIEKIDFKKSSSFLSRLETLYLDNQGITKLPNAIGELTNLKNLYLYGNKLEVLPETIGLLTNLKFLDVSDNNLIALPESIGELTNLESFRVRENKIKNLPRSFTNLRELESLDLRDNNFDKTLLNAYGEGISSLFNYLKQLNISLNYRYESKLILLGDGGEGKTCVSRALRRKPFKEQLSTKGVEVIPWSFTNPKFGEDKSKKITLNIWDFEGQEIHHQTHQFFLTEGSIYLLVFKCREIFRMDRAEYWLDTISSRAPNSKVFLIITECEERQPLVPLDKLKQKYPELLNEEQWFFPVGCMTDYGIEGLREKIKQVASELDIMGIEWPDSYAQIEAHVSNLASENEENKPYLTRGQLERIFSDYGIKKDNYKFLARTLDNHGLITQFPDCLSLSDFIVIKPQWLTKAISMVLEDRETVKGEIQHLRLKELWEENYSGLYSIFHECMKEFELCYELDKGNSSLIPLRFDHIKPDIPWSLNSDYREREVQYKLNLRPPMGLMSRFIVKVHHLIVKTKDKPKGIFWHNGVFLKTGRKGNFSEALCEFNSENKTLSILVRSAFPQNMIEQLHGIFLSVLEFYDGLRAERYYGCINIDQDNVESRCKGLHTEDLIIFSLSKNLPVTCATGLHQVSPKELLYGFTSSGQGVTKKELKKLLNNKPAWANDVITDLPSSLETIDEYFFNSQYLRFNQKDLTNEFKQQIELLYRDHLKRFNNMLDDRDYNSAPSIVSISLKDKSAWNPKSWFKKELILTPYCECGNEEIHKVEDAIVSIKLPKEWWQKTAPKLKLGFKILAAGISVSYAGLPMTMGEQDYKDIAYEANFTKELVNQIKPEFQADQVMENNKKEGAKLGGDSQRGNGEEEMNRIARRQLAEIFKAISLINYESKEWGSLRRVYSAESNTYRWLCPKHR